MHYEMHLDEAQNIQNDTKAVLKSLSAQMIRQIL